VFAKIAEAMQALEACEIPGEMGVNKAWPTVKAAYPDVVRDALKEAVRERKAVRSYLRMGTSEEV